MLIRAEVVYVVLYLPIPEFWIIFVFLYPPRTKSSALRATSTEVRGKLLFQYDKFIITLSSTTFFIYLIVSLT